MALCGEGVRPALTLVALETLLTLVEMAQQGAAATGGHRTRTLPPPPPPGIGDRMLSVNVVNSVVLDQKFVKVLFLRVGLLLQVCNSDLALSFLFTNHSPPYSLLLTHPPTPSPLASPHHVLHLLSQVCHGVAVAHVEFGPRLLACAGGFIAVMATLLPHDPQCLRDGYPRAVCLTGEPSSSSPYLQVFKLVCFVYTICDEYH